MTSAAAFPGEIFDLICGFVYDPNDLLALGLTCRAMRNMIIPDHLYYRHIRCDAYNTREVWEGLLSRRKQASRIQHLEITTTWPEIVPPFPVARDAMRIDRPILEVDKEGRRMVSEAIPYLPSLKRFRWKRDHMDDHIMDDERLMSSLVACPQLSEVEILNKGYWYSIRDAGLPTSKLWCLTNLTRFSYSELLNDFHRQTYIEYTQKLADMLVQCPSLRDLQLHFHWSRTHRVQVEEPLLQVFRRTTWPMLERLCIDAIFLSSRRQEPSDNFLSRHPRIWALCVKRGGFSGLSALSGLTDLSMDIDLNAAAIPRSIASQLVHLDIELKETQGKSFSLWEARSSPLGAAKGLKSLVVRSKVLYKGPLRNLVVLVPQIQRLSLVFLDAWERSQYINTLTALDAEFLSETLDGLPALTHFSPAYLGAWAPVVEADATSSSEYIPDRIDTAIQRVFLHAPNLQYIGVLDDDQYGDGIQWFMVEKDEKGEYQDYHDAPDQSHDDKQNIDIHLWSNIYYGVGDYVVHKWYEEFDE